MKIEDLKPKDVAPLLPVLRIGTTLCDACKDLRTSVRMCIHMYTYVYIYMCLSFTFAVRCRIVCLRVHYSVCMCADMTKHVHAYAHL